MRFNDIDLYGHIKFIGITGSSGQFIQINDSLPVWVTQSIPQYKNLAKSVGRNTIIVESVQGDELTSGNNLLRGYNSAVTLANTIGVSEQNRITILIMPGVYDISSNQLTINTSFIDLIGVSSNPMNTVLKSTSNQQVIIYGNGVDSKLENLSLQNGTSISFSQQGSAYLRWTNLFLTGNGFYDGSSIYSCENLTGEFRKIKVLNSNFAVANYSLDGIFEDIDITVNFGESPRDLFYTLTYGPISGTYSNIYISANQSERFFDNSAGSEPLTGTFKDIEIITTNSVVSRYIFGAGGTLSGHFENIKFTSTIGTSDDTIFFSNNENIISTFKNIYLDLPRAEDVWISGLGSLIGTFENIEINSEDEASNGSAFKSSGSIIATFSNIRIEGPDYGEIIYSAGSDKEMKLDIDDFSITECGMFIVNDPSNGNGGTVSGTFRNINISKNRDLVFYTRDSILGNFENITLSNLVGANCFYSVSGIIGGNYKDIDMFNVEPTVTNVFRANEINGTFENILCFGQSNTNNNFFTSITNIFGKYKDLSFYYSSTIFDAADIDIELENLTSYNICQSGLVKATNTIKGKYKNINTTQSDFLITTSGDINVDLDGYERSGGNTPGFLISGGQILGSYKNIKIASFNTTVVTGTNINAIFENYFSTGNGNQNLNQFISDNDIIGTFSNVSLVSLTQDAFKAGNEIKGYFKDIRIGDQRSYNAFDALLIASSSVFENVQSNNFIPAVFYGTMRNCVFSDPNIQNPGVRSLQISNSATIENSDIYYWERITDGITGQTIDLAIKDISSEGYDNAQLLFNGLLRPLEPMEYSGGQGNIGITALEPNFNVTYIKTPKF